MSIQYARLNVLRNCSLDESMPNIPLRAGLLAMYLRIQPFIFNHRLIYGTRRPFIGRSSQEALSIIAPPRLWLGVVCVKKPFGDNNTKETCCWFFLVECVVGVQAKTQLNIVGSRSGIGFCVIALLVLHDDKGFGTTLERVEERQPVIFCLLVLRKRSYWILRRRRKIADLHFSILIGYASLGTDIDKWITTSTQKGHFYHSKFGRIRTCILSWFSHI